jgi:hypothetical protein
MAQIDDELAIRGLLADLTSDQPPVPPARYAAVRRRVVVHRRRQLAGAAAAVAILVAAAIAIPLGLVHLGPQPPSAPSRHYRVSEYPPGPHSQHGLVASGTMNGRRWNLTIDIAGGFSLCWSADVPTAVAGVPDCTNAMPARASRSGAPAFLLGQVGGPEQVNVGTVRSDVAYLKVAYSNGQILTAYPTAVFSRPFARYVAVVTPFPAAMTSVTAYSGTGRDLGYAVPFTGDGSVDLNHWLRPGQPALPRPHTYVIGSGTVRGNRWHEDVWIGPWGTCFGGSGGGSGCFAVTGSLLSYGQLATTFGLSAGGGSTEIAYGEVTPAVSYLLVTGSNGATERVTTTAAGKLKFFAYAQRGTDPVVARVSWAAFSAQGQRLAAGRGDGP